MVKDMRNLVRKGYDNGKYDVKYGRKNSVPENFARSLCDELISQLKPNSKILDLGCGIGLPFDKYFSKKGLSVTGIDISERHIEKAKRNVKSARYILGDFFSKEIKGKFDAIVSFYAIFHIPRTEHQKLLNYINSLLKKGGLILLTFGLDSMKYDFNPNFAGAPMAWSSYAADKNKKIVENAGFEILISTEDYRTERHLWILAKKK